jgi:hypothetical protein
MYYIQLSELNRRLKGKQIIPTDLLCKSKTWGAGGSSMSKMKSSLLDKRIAQFFESTTELLTDIHARNKGENNGTSTKKRRKPKSTSIPKPDTVLRDKEPSGK